MQDGTITLADWGSAKVDSEHLGRPVFHPDTGNPERNYDNVPCGSKYYSPPEARYFFSPSQIGKPVQGVRWDASAGDVWSFGVTLFVLISGRQPWRHAHIDDPEFVAYTKASGQGPALVSMMEHIAGSSGRAAAEDALAASTAKWGWSRMISTSCRHLLRSILRISYHERPHMGMVLAHPWLQSAVPLVPRRTPDSAATVGLPACAAAGSLSQSSVSVLMSKLQDLSDEDRCPMFQKHWNLLEKPDSGCNVESCPPMTELKPIFIQPVIPMVSGEEFAQHLFPGGAPCRSTVPVPASTTSSSPSKLLGVSMESTPRSASKSSYTTSSCPCDSMVKPAGAAACEAELSTVPRDSGSGFGVCRSQPGSDIM